MWGHRELGETMWLFLSVSPLINKMSLFFFNYNVQTQVINMGEQNVRQAQAVAFLIGEGKYPSSWAS